MTTPTLEYTLAIESIRRLHRAGFGFNFSHDPNRSLNAVQLETLMHGFRGEMDTLRRVLANPLEKLTSSDIFYQSSLYVGGDSHSLYVRSRVDQLGNTNTSIMPQHFDGIVGVGYRSGHQPAYFFGEPSFVGEPTLTSFNLFPPHDIVEFTISDSDPTPQKDHHYTVFMHWKDEPYFKENPLFISVSPYGKINGED